MSDSDSSKDSDCGIRFKTVSVRQKKSAKNPYDRSKCNEEIYNKQYNTTSLVRKHHKSHKNKKSTKSEHKLKNKSSNYIKQSKHTSSSDDCKTNNIKNNVNNQNLKLYNVSDCNSSENDTNRVFGPSLPTTNLKNNELNVNKNDGISKNKINKNDDDSQIMDITSGSTLSTKSIDDDFENNDTELKTKVYGPLLPTESIINNDLYGPSLPKMENTYSERLASPSETLTSDSKIYGPSLPAGLGETVTVNNESYKCELPKYIKDDSQSNSSDENEDIIGPLPFSDTKSVINSQLEIRALELKLKENVSEDKKKSREEWMLTLPDVKLFQGVGPRQFRSTTGPDFTDRSVWTDTPRDKAMKNKTKKLSQVDLIAESEYQEMKKRDQEQEKISKREKKQSKRDQSLLDIHREKLKKKKKETGSAERRPFDRDIDLKLNKIDPTKKSVMIKNASLLDSKFSAGKSKFL